MIIRKTLCLYTLLVALPVNAYNLRQLSSREGLSNSSILSICQDQDRFIWFGTADGLNMYDGVNIRIYKPTANQPNSLSGNMIEGILEAENGVLWIGSNQGFNRLEKKTKTIEHHRQFSSKYHFAKNTDNDIFVIHTDNQIDCYDKNKQAFTALKCENINAAEVMNFFIDNQHTLWIFYYSGLVHKARILYREGIPELTFINDFKHHPMIRYCFYEDNKACFIDENHDFFELETLSGKKTLLMNIRTIMEGKGEISAIIRDNDDFLLAFQTNGLIRLKNTPEKEIKYMPERIEIRCGVLSLLKDPVQDIIWIGTDGQGVYIYSRNSVSIRSTTFNELPFGLQKPIRSLFLDTQNTLWIGTRDDGILKIKDYCVGCGIDAKKTELITVDNSELTNNSIYAFAPGSRQILWIGNDGPGLNYYSYKDHKIRRLKGSDNAKIRYVHAICEINDSTLWLASGGMGIYRITLSGASGYPEIKDLKTIRFSREEQLNNYFFSICRENDSILWFGNRGYGAIRLNVVSGKFSNIHFYKENTEAINDILSIHKDQKENIWFGTSFGLVKLLSFENGSATFENYNESEGLPNNTIHSILEDDKNNLWFSTNRGIGQFDAQKGAFKIYDYQNGLKTIEFSDGASWRDEKSRTLFFGGTNGFVTFKQDIYEEMEFTPKIFFTNLKIYEIEYNIADLMKKKGNDEYLELKYDQNFFSISFVALDYINGQNRNYHYNLERFNDKWIAPGHSNTAAFTNIPPGDYTLHVKSINKPNDPQPDIYSLKIRILPPWYMSAGAYLCYTVNMMLIIFFSIKTIRRRYRLRREAMIEKLNQQQKEEIYESKLRFFTNITHELCTPLTLIYGPCDRIVSHPGIDAHVKKYANLILRNAERLNTLIQELIEFRRIDTGHKTRKIERLPISKLAKSIAGSFVELSETKAIEYTLDIHPDIYWNSDKSSFTKILNNLLSNAFKYTPDGGAVSLVMNASNDNLTLVVSNTGKGIKAEDIPLIFDRYRVLENFEKQTSGGFSSRNGLGLAICHSMVKLLEGEIEVESVPYSSTVFRVSLPAIEAGHFPEKADRIDDKLPVPLQLPVFPIEEHKFYRSRQTILVIDDDPEMLWFISEIFTEQYNIIPIENSKTVLDILSQFQPHLIISDVMMPGPDGISLTRMIKTNKKTTHIPLILLSAKNMPEEQVEGINAGAEAYITKPFNVNYLKSVVERLIQRQDDLKEYYSSVLSAFELTDGQFVHKKDKDFFENALKIIEKNITNPAFSSEKLASDMGISVRHLYRRLKAISQYSPIDLIKEYKLNLSEKLLISTNLTIEEIMYKAGFQNRGNFYRLFSQKYKTTPKNYRKIKKKEALK